MRQPAASAEAWKARQMQKISRCRVPDLPEMQEGEEEDSIYSNCAQGR
jgi:hypothetical protein